MRKLRLPTGEPYAASPANRRCCSVTRTGTYPSRLSARWDDPNVRLTAGRDLDATVAKYRSAEVTYAPVGATRGDLPAGYGHTQRRVRVGTGEEAFGRAADAVLTWEMHHRSGLVVAAQGPAVEGRTVVLLLGVGLKLVIPCRVVYV